MARLAGPAQKEAIEKVRRLLAFREDGILSEDQIAEELGFKSGLGGPPARMMYIRLENLGLPEWLVYPVAPKAKGKERKARTFGQAKTELPGAG